MSTLALQLGQLFMFQKFEQTMVNLIFDTMDRSILWNETDEGFKILTPYSFKSELSMHFINLY